MNVKIEDSWKAILKSEFEKDYFEKLIAFVKNAYNTSKVYPKGSEIFNAFEKCPFENAKVIILGQDPYHGAGQAHGLSFSVNDGVDFPPSLRNIFKEVQSDIGKPFPTSGNLVCWAEQGVLLLNATLTVEADKAGSHQNQGWEIFTDAVIQKLSSEKKNLVFMLWGAYAQKKGAFIDTSKHFILKAKHPSPLAANQGGWFGMNHFSQCNNYLKANDLKEINW